MRAIILDFDGVIVESVDIKTQAFADLFADEPAHLPAILALHRANGGMSRLAKFDLIYRDILRRPLAPEQKEQLNRRFSKLVVEQVVACPYAPGALEFLQAYSAAIPLFVASGTPEDELQMIVARRGLAEYFRGVYGLPPNKTEIIRRLLGEQHCPAAAAVFVGDAVNDYTAAVESGVKFVGRVPPGAPNPFPVAGPAAIVPDLHAFQTWLQRREPDEAR